MATIFTSGLDYLDWCERNCDLCAKGGDQAEPGSSQCELFEALADAACDDGEVSEEVAQRIGKGRRCKEFVKPAPEKPVILSPEIEMKNAGAVSLWEG